MLGGLYLLGAGGHGRVLLDSLQCCSQDVRGILDPSLPIGTKVFGVPVWGDDSLLSDLAQANATFVNGIGANPSLASRYEMSVRLSTFGSVLGVIHPSAVISSNASVSNSAQILAGAIIQTGVAIGAHAVLNTGARIDHDCRIEDYSFIGPGAILCGSVVVEERVFIAAGSIVLPGVRIGSGAVIGAGVTVSCDVPSSAVIRRLVSGCR